MAVTSNTQSGENIVAFTWTVESVKEHFTSMMRESDRRYEERFIAQEKAIDAALVAQEKAVQAALISAKEAVLKQERDSEKRFDAVNEFRQTLSDQAATFIARTEAVQRDEQNAEKIATLEKRMNDSFTQVNSRLDLGAGRSIGMNAIWGYIIGGVGLTASIITIAIVLNK